MGRLATWPSRIFTLMASMKITAYTESNGLLCHSARPSMTRSVIPVIDRKSTRLNSSHPSKSYAVFCLKQKTIHKTKQIPVRFSYEQEKWDREEVGVPFENFGVYQTVQNYRRFFL